MTRPLRKEFENGWYHVMNRGAGKKVIYKSDNHRLSFLSLLHEAHLIFGIEIHAYCLMGNHYHLLIRTPRANLSKAMRHINGVYTQRFNRSEKTDGSLFRGRYKSIIVSFNEYLLNVSRYIHLNPVTAKIQNDAAKYRWSSYKYYINPHKKPIWLFTNETLSIFNCENSLLAHIAYKEFVTSGIDQETRKFYTQVKLPAIFGATSFTDNILNSLTEENIRASLPDYNHTKTLPTMDRIIDVVIAQINTSRDELKKIRRGKANDARSIAIYGCRNWSEESLARIAVFFGGTSISNISNIIFRVKIKMKSSREFRNMLEKVWWEVGSGK